MNRGARSFVKMGLPNTQIPSTSPGRTSSDANAVPRTHPARIDSVWD